MPQPQLPLFFEDLTYITNTLAFERKSGEIIYFNGILVVFRHAEDDTKTFRMITSQFCVNGIAKQSDIARAFGVTTISVKRAVKIYRAKGPGGFYEPRNVRGATVLTPLILDNVQKRLDEGVTLPTIATEFELKQNTLEKAIRANRLRYQKKILPSLLQAQAKANAAKKIAKQHSDEALQMYSNV